ncbi:hypothetical protein GA840_04075 [Pediococcus ethanolidurans]|uniref:hypothetical protein n=1 Tax=Pediococcus ethanolidurans TaxID=319653 RepID=UPI002953C4C7|nr:hypothetical protein [Pediococcus ethanolidurans]MDV7719026.1 hypothetical protein [Pediococcus ethanolidurans]
MNKGLLVKNEGDFEATSEGLLLLDTHEQIIREHKAKKSVDSNDNIKYYFTDAESVEKEYKFKSTGDFVLDQNKGLAYEHSQNYTSAIEAYESAFKLSIKDPCGPPPNIFFREAIIYRKLKEYDKEVAIIELGIKYETSSSKTATARLRQRLPKARELLNKNK